MSREALLALMRDRLGLDAETLGERVLDDACADARRSLGVGSDADLYHRALFDPEAFADCLERFVVPESWFFRAGEQYEDLVRFARETLQREGRPLRVLSLPCAAGEEAHSAVIALLEAGIPAEAIDVLGIDVSRLAVQRAQAGVYRRSALRGQPVSPVWMQETGDGFIVDAAVRRCARFRTGNALDPHLLRMEDRFDVVFCRNLLIYLHPQARQELVKTLLAALQTPGLVLAGQAEVLTAFSDELQPYEGGCPLSYVRRKKPAAASAPALPEPLQPVPASARQATAERRAAEQARLEQVQAAGPLPPAPETATPPAGEVSIVDVIAEARRLADAGRIDQAREVCQQRLALHPTDVPALFLMGLLESATGNTEAADSAFVRVLYLDRHHLDALQQRIGLAERRGLIEQAQELRARVARMRRRQEGDG